MMQWLIGATLLFCGASVFTACTGSDDNAVSPDAGETEIAHYFHTI